MIKTLHFTYNTEGEVKGEIIIENFMPWELGHLLLMLWSSLPRANRAYVLKFMQDGMKIEGNPPSVEAMIGDMVKTWYEKAKREGS